MASTNEKKSKSKKAIINEYTKQFGSMMLFPYKWTSNEKLLSLNSRAHQLYQFLWSRNIVSLYSGHFDKKGRPYVICSRKEAADYLNIKSLDSVTKYFKELREKKLIREIPTSGKNMIFVRDAESGKFKLKRISGEIKKVPYKTRIKSKR